MKKKIISAILVVMCGLSLFGCTEVARVSQNLKQEADNFNVVRQVTAIDCITGETLFQVTGKISIESNTEKKRLEIISEENGSHKIHYVGISDNLTYVVEQLDVKDVDKYKFTINYNPKMWIPIGFENVD